jgi:hypothetical protein
MGKAISFGLVIVALALQGCSSGSSGPEKTGQTTEKDDSACDSNNVPSCETLYCLPDGTWSCCNPFIKPDCQGATCTPGGWLCGVTGGCRTCRY